MEVSVYRFGWVTNLPTMISAIQIITPRDRTPKGETLNAEAIEGERIHSRSLRFPWLNASGFCGRNIHFERHMMASVMDDGEGGGNPRRREAKCKVMGKCAPSGVQPHRWEINHARESEMRKWFRVLAWSDVFHASSSGPMQFCVFFFLHNCFAYPEPEGNLPVYVYGFSFVCHQRCHCYQHQHRRSTCEIWHPTDPDRPSGGEVMGPKPGQRRPRVRCCFFGVCFVLTFASAVDDSGIDAESGILAFCLCVDVEVDIGAVNAVGLQLFRVLMKQKHEWK